MIRRDFLRACAAGAVFAAGPAHAAGPRSAAHPFTPSPVHPFTKVPPSPISPEERAEFRERARALMEEHGIDAVFIESGPSLEYFTGVRWGRSERPFGMLLPRTAEPVLISPAFEVGRARNEAGDAFEILGWEEDRGAYDLIADTLRGWGIRGGRVAVDGQGRYFIAHGVASAAPSLEIVPADPVVNGCRGIKTDHELALLRHANEITLASIQEAFATLSEGTTQRELAAAVRAGYERHGFPGGWVLALIGESSAYPHGAENPRPLSAGDVVLVDAGTEVHGYQGDVTRTIVFGEPTAEQREVYAAVREAQTAALAATEPGRTAGSIDAVARDVIARAGYGPDYRYFTHRLGHGIGMEGHEWPYLVRGSDVVLRPGMTFSNEPGIYQQGKFGVRLEDIMVVTEEGAELLTPQAEGEI